MFSQINEPEFVGNLNSPNTSQRFENKLMRLIAQAVEKVFTVTFSIFEQPFNPPNRIIMAQSAYGATMDTGHYNYCV